MQERVAAGERRFSEHMNAAMTEFRTTVLAIRDQQVALGNSRAKAGVTPIYVVSSLFLTEAFRGLVQDADEDMRYVTGVEFGPVRVLERLLDFAKLDRSPVRVAGDPAATHRTLIELAATGHRLTAWMHSHPGKGQWATRPSPTDIDHQRLLEQGRYPAIGAIFSRDGYVRFFSAKNAFRVELFGANTRRIDERVYRLVLD